MYIHLMTLLLTATLACAHSTSLLRVDSASWIVFRSDHEAVAVQQGTVEGLTSARVPYRVATDVHWMSGSPWLQLGKQTRQSKAHLLVALCELVIAI